MIKTITLLLTAMMLFTCAATTEPAPLTPKGATAIPAPAAETTPTVEPTEAPTSEPTPEPTPEATSTPEPGRLAGIKIGIDPGHQAHENTQKEAIAPHSKEKKPKVSSGTRGRTTGVPEYVTVLEIGLKLRDALEAEGAEVKMTRETHDVDISNQERAIMMNEWGADLVLRIHCDGANKKSINGISLYVNKSFPISKESKAAAECLLPRMVEATGANRRGIFERDTYTGLNWSTVPSILVECGYMSNPEEDERLNDPEYQQKLAEGMVEGICDYFER